MQERNPVRLGSLIAGCFALTAFAVAIASGLAAGVASASILQRAFVGMLLCYPIGLAAGCLFYWIVDQHDGTRESAKAAPDSPVDRGMWPDGVDSVERPSGDQLLDLA